MSDSQKLIIFLQSGITPVALISGVGLLLLTLNNRLGRTVDRTRMLMHRLETAGTTHPNIVKDELKILYKRSRILRSSIASISLSIITSSLIIIVLLLMHFTSFYVAWLGKGLFALSIAGILASAIFLFADVVLTLKALKIEINLHLRDD